MFACSDKKFNGKGEFGD